MTRRSLSFSTVIMAICVAAYIAQTGSGDDLAYRFGVYGPLIVEGEIYRLLTGGFLHTGAVHLFANMLSLFFLGRLIEPAFEGRSWGFPTLYLGSLIGGSIGAMLLEYEATAIGASGAIYGLMGAAIGIPLRRGLGWNRTGVAPWIAFNLLFTLSVPGVSLGGHLGGLLAGFVLGWLLA